MPMGRLPTSHRWPGTEQEWVRFRDRYNPLIDRIARAQGITDPDEIGDVRGKIWSVLLIHGYIEQYDPVRGPLEGFLVAIMKTVCFFEADHERRRQKRLVRGDGGPHEDRTQVQRLASVEFWLLYERADAAVSQRRVNSTSGPELLRRVWAGVKNDESRQEMAAATGYSEQYIALMVKELREIPEVRDLVSAT